MRLAHLIKKYKGREFSLSALVRGLSLIYRRSVPLTQLFGLPLLIFSSPFFALKEGLNLRKKVPCEDFQFVFWDITSVGCHKATRLLFHLLSGHSSFTLPDHTHTLLIFLSRVASVGHR